MVLSPQPQAAVSLSLHSIYVHRVQSSPLESRTTGVSPRFRDFSAASFWRFDPIDNPKLPIVSFLLRSIEKLLKKVFLLSKQKRIIRSPLSLTIFKNQIMLYAKPICRLACYSENLSPTVSYHSLILCAVTIVFIKNIVHFFTMFLKTAVSIRRF